MDSRNHEGLAEGWLTRIDELRQKCHVKDNCLGIQDV
jgi:hypothetical protein